jgi:hypothetical protein
MLEHILNNVVQLLGPVFTAGGVLLPQTWDEVSPQHIEVFRGSMAGLRKQRQILDVSQLPLPLRAWDTLSELDSMGIREMLEDATVDAMIQFVAMALGVKMKGVNVVGASKMLKIGAEPNNFHVMGVAQANSLRTVISPIAYPAGSKVRECQGLRTGSQDRPGSDNDDSDLVMKASSGEKESHEAAVERALRIVTMKANVPAVLAKTVDIFDGKKSVLIVAMHQSHATVSQLTRDSNGAQAAQPSGWTMTHHDPMKRVARWDTNLRQGMNLLLTTAGLKDANSNFKYERVSPTDFVLQAPNQCGAMAMLKLIMLLTGETLDTRHRLNAAELILVFFDAWLYLKAEQNGAISCGFLREAIRKAARAAAMEAAGGTVPIFAGHGTFPGSEDQKAGPASHDSDDVDEPGRKPGSQKSAEENMIIGTHGETEPADDQEKKRIEREKREQEWRVEHQKKEQEWRAERKRVLAAIACEYRQQGRSLTPDGALLLGKIFLEYQANDFQILSLHGKTHGVMVVLCQYVGEGHRVVGANDIMLSGGKFEIWISNVRRRERWHNDPILRHAAIFEEMCRRTQHSDVGKRLVPPLRIFPHRRYLGFASTDSTQKASSVGRTFMAVKHNGASFKQALKDCMSASVGPGGEKVLADAFRRQMQRLIQSITDLNLRGLALGQAAINDFRQDEEGLVVGLLTGSSLFPAENVSPMSTQARNNPAFMLRHNTSRNDGHVAEKGKPGKEVTIHHLDANKLAATITKNGKRGCSSLVADEDIQVEMTTAGSGKILQKEWAYMRDHRSLALMIASFVCGPSEPQESVLSILKDRSTTQQLVAKFRTGLDQASIGASDDTLKKIADWAFASFALKLETNSSSKASKPATALRGLAYQLFFTTYIFPPAQLESLYADGILIGPRSVASGPFKGQRLPAIRFRVQENKGPGLEADQPISGGTLLGLYVGEFDTDTDGRPASRMVLKLTSSKYDSWGYCFGEENFERCMAIPALFSYANAPGPGEASNCKVDRDKEERYTEDGIKMVAIPVYAIGDKAKGDPLYWDYDHEAGPGMFI